VNAFHVCITSYKLVIQDHAAFRRKKWKYFILDEAQNIKNFKSQRWQCLLNFQSQRRLLLTGTPLQNNLMELWSLMHFLMPHVFSSHREFQHWFSNPLKFMIEGNQEYNEQLIKRLHKVLRPFILRRLKIDVEKQMPKKYEHIIMCKLSKRQRLLYDEFMSLSSTKKKLAEGHYMSVINILMQLRKVCNHPDLFEPRPIVSSFVTESIHFHVPSCVYNLTNDLDDKTQNLFFYQPSLCDMELKYSVFECHRAKQLQTSRKLIEDLIQRNITTNDSTKTPSSSTFFPNSNLEGLAINDLDSKLNEQIRQQLLYSAVKSQYNSDRLKNKLKYLIRTNKWHCSAKPIYGLDLHACIGNDKIIATLNSSNSYATCQQAFKYELQTNKCISTNGFWSQTNTLLILLTLIREQLYNPKLNHILNDILNRFIIYIPQVVYAAKTLVNDPFDANAGSLRLHVAHPLPSLYQKQRLLIEDITLQVAHLNANSLCTKFESLTSTQFPEKRLIQYDCGKLQVLSDLLRQLYADTHRVLLFTQMTRMLDILENFLNYHGFKYLRLDGSTSIEQRQVLMERFNNDKRIFCFILSTRSGGIGVNLTGADTVIFYDSDWNPTMDAQAQDRCHRIGQTRDVHIYRLISTKTVEENILKKANQKRLLSEMTIEGGCFTTALLKKHHISELFNNNNNNNNDQTDNLLAISPVQVQSQVSIDDTEMIIQVDSNLKATSNDEEQIVSDTQFEDVKYYFDFIFIISNYYLKKK
jgi:E1A-binding protein p400